MCQCEASCVYSDKGPWTEIENRVNYRDPKPDSDSDDLNEGYNFGVKMQMGNAFGLGKLKGMK